MGKVLVGPNHVLHGVLTLLTFWACGGWAWVWLVVALQNHKRVVPADEYGRPLPPTYDRLGAVFIDDAGTVRWVNVAALAAGIVAVILLVAVINL